MSNKIITEEMFLDGNVKFKEPKILSRKDKGYFEKYASHLTMSDVECLCEILQHPNEEIFAKGNLDKIRGYEPILLGGKEYCIGSSRVKDLLFEIGKGTLKKNDVLHDTSKLLSKHNPEELSLKVRVYNKLIEEEYLFNL